jgi:cysteine desulfurase
MKNILGENMEAYLDNSATTSCLPEAAELMMSILTQEYGNPSSMHNMGVTAENYINEAKKKIAKTLKVQEKEIYFTSGGTESNNIAIFGSVRANQRAGKHVITSGIEHASVANPFRQLEEDGYEVTYLSVNEYGEISLEELKNAVRTDTILVSLMHVNNEIGAIEPVEEAGRIIKEQNPQTLFHVDAIQSYGKLRIAPKKMNIDLLSVSGHKIHGPKGSGFLYIKDKTKIKPLVYGGGQQKGMRSGTENVPAIAGLGVAAEAIYTDFEDKIEHLYQIRERFISGAQQLPGVTVNGRTDRNAAPHIVSVSVEGVRAEVLLHTLEDKGIYVSAGSACSSNKPSVSRTLKSIGLKENLLDSTVRFSFCVETTTEEIDYALQVLGEVIPVLQKYMRK